MSQSKSLSYFLLLVVAVVFVSAFSVSTSFLYPYPDTLDSHVFQIIGKYWARGSIPYVDLWDQKGPIIYFINAVGYWMTDSKTGVFLLQILFLFADLCILYHIFRSRLSVRNSFIVIVLFLFSLAQLYGAGNGVEEYILPFLLIGFYLQYKWIISFVYDDENQHNPRWAILYGFILAFSLLTRLTNALGICLGVAFIGIMLALNRKWKNLFYNIAAFIVGFAILFIPFASYFYVHNAFDEMWYAMITFNMEYASNASNIVTIKSFLLNLLSPICAYMCLVVGFLLLLRKHYIIGYWIIAIVLFPLIWIITSNGYAHYSMLCLPYLMISFLLLNDYDLMRVLSTKTINSLRLSFSLVIIVSCIFVNLRSLTNGYFYRSSKEKRLFFKSMLSHIQNQEQDSFIAYNIKPSIYLYSGIKPAFRFFTNQYFYCLNSKSMSKLMYGENRKHNVKWLLIKQEDQTMNIIVKNEYTESIRSSFEGKEYVLYKRNK